MTTAAVYLRVSLDSTGEHLAVTRQREDCLKMAADRGWAVVDEYVDNSISASDRAKVRPGYDRLVADYAAGRFDALICWDLDRLTRQPRQLEDWIDAAEQRGLKLVTANGEADLRTDGGRMYARVKAAVARSEVERKSARQKRAQQQRASMGKPPKGVRLTGYSLAGEVVPMEARLVRDIFDSFTAGDTLIGIATRLQGTGVPTRRGGRWSSPSVSSILKNARYAGRSVYNGETVAEATWPAIVPPEQFDAVQSRLADPRRKTNGGDTARKHIGSGVYRCSCGLPIRSSSGDGTGRSRYNCRDGCFRRNGDHVDGYVLAVIRGRLALPDLQQLLVRPTDEAELATLTAERDQLQNRLATVESDYDEGHIDGRRYREAREKVLARLSAVQQRQGRLIASDASSSVLAAPDPVAAFDAAPLAIQQRMIGMLAEVTLHPSPRGRKAFDPATVTIEWRAS